MRRVLSVTGMAVILWLAVGLAGARMGGPDFSLRSASAGEVADPAPTAPAWVALVAPALHRVPGSRVDLPLRHAPLAHAPSAGKLRLSRAEDGRILTTWIPPGGRPEVPVRPGDPGSFQDGSRWNHLTILEERGPWFLLPADPFPAPVWVDLSPLGVEPPVLRLQPGMVLESHRGDLVVVEARQDAVRVRPLAAECGGANPPDSRSSESFTLRGRALRDPNGHLRVRVKSVMAC